MTAAIEVDRSQKMLIVVRFQRGPTDEDFARYLSEYTAVLESEPRFGAVFVTAAGQPMASGRHVRMQADFMKAYSELIQERVVGVAFALGSQLMRGVLRGVLMIQPMPCPHTVVGTEAEGLAWVKAKLWTDHVRRMKGPTSSSSER